MSSKRYVEPRYSKDWSKDQPLTLGGVVGSLIDIIIGLAVIAIYVIAVIRILE